VAQQAAAVQPEAPGQAEGQMEQQM